MMGTVFLRYSNQGSYVRLSMSLSADRKQYIYIEFWGKLKSLVGRLMILSKVEIMKMETMKIAVFRDVTPCNEETALCNIKITMLYTELGKKQWQTTPKNLPRMQCARAVPVTWLGSGSCQPGLLRLNTNEWMNEYTEQVPQTSTELNWLRSSSLVLAALNLRVLSADSSLVN